MQAPIVNTPLGLIALFVAVIELFLAYPVTQLGGNERLIMVVFMVTFPFFVAGMFFFVLWHRPLHLYAPQDIPADLQVRVQEDTATFLTLKVRVGELESENAALRNRAAPPEAAVLSPARAAELAPAGADVEVKQLADEVKAAIGTSNATDDRAVERVKVAVERRRSETKADQRRRVTRTMKEFREWLEGVGFTDLPEPLKVIVETASMLNAWYDRTDHTLHTGALLVDDVDTTTATYFQAVIDRLGVLGSAFTGGHLGTFAVAQAFCDYYACSYSNDPRLGEVFAAVLTKKGYAGAYATSEALRDLSVAMTMSEAPEEPHERSRVFSSACWEIRSEIGQAKTDAWLCAALAKMPAEADFIVAANVVHEEFKTSGSAKAAKVVERAFKAREIAV